MSRYIELNTRMEVGALGVINRHSTRRFEYENIDADPLNYSSVGLRLDSLLSRVFAERNGISIVEEEVTKEIDGKEFSITERKAMQGEVLVASEFRYQTGSDLREGERIPSRQRFLHGSLDGAAVKVGLENYYEVKSPQHLDVTQERFFQVGEETSGRVAMDRLSPFTFEDRKQIARAVGLFVYNT